MVLKASEGEVQAIIYLVLKATVERIGPTGLESSKPDG
jgi:hypothetical protein